VACRAALAIAVDEMLAEVIEALRAHIQHHWF
jgi:hypothetical protein